MPRFTDRLDTTIHIAAPPARVWAVLADLPGWADWNPFIRSISGTLTPGATLSATMHPRGRRPMTLRPVVIHAEPGERLVWRGHLPVPGLFEGTHSLVLTRDGTGTRLDHAESFRGLLVAFLRAGSFRADFDAMNAALRTRAES